MVETLSLLLVILIFVVFLSAAVTGFFFRHIGWFSRIIMLAGAIGGVILCTHREAVSQPLTFAAATAVTLAFLFYVHLRKSRQSTAP